MQNVAIGLSGTGIKLESPRPFARPQRGHLKWSAWRRLLLMFILLDPCGRVDAGIIMKGQAPRAKA